MFRYHHIKKNYNFQAPFRKDLLNKDAKAVSESSERTVAEGMIGGKKRNGARLFEQQGEQASGSMCKKRPRLLTPISPTFQTCNRSMETVGIDFLALPTDLIFQVLSMLDFFDFVSILATCRSVYSAAESNWLRLIKLRWPNFQSHRVTKSSSVGVRTNRMFKQYYLSRLKLESLPCTAFHKSIALIKPAAGSSLDAATYIALNENSRNGCDSPVTALSEEPSASCLRRNASGAASTVERSGSVVSKSQGSVSGAPRLCDEGELYAESVEGSLVPKSSSRKRQCGSQSNHEFLGGGECLAFELLQQVNRLIQARVVRNDIPDASTPTFVKTSYLASLQLQPFSVRLDSLSSLLQTVCSSLPLPVYYVFQVDRKSYTQPFGVQSMLFSQVNAASCPIALTVSWVAATEGGASSSTATPASVYNYWKSKYSSARSELITPLQHADLQGKASAKPTSSAANGMYPAFNAHARCSFPGQRGYYEFSVNFRGESVLVVNVSRFHHHRLGVPNFTVIDKELQNLGYPVNNGWRRYMLGVTEHLYKEVFDKCLISTRRHDRKLTLNDPELLADAVGHYELWDWIDLLLYERLKRKFEAEPQDCLVLEKAWFRSILDGLI